MAPLGHYSIAPSSPLRPPPSTKFPSLQRIPRASRLLHIVLLFCFRISCVFPSVSSFKPSVPLSSCRQPSNFSLIDPSLPVVTGSGFESVTFFDKTGSSILQFEFPSYHPFIPTNKSLPFCFKLMSWAACLSCTCYMDVITYYVYVFSPHYRLSLLHPHILICLFPPFRYSGSSAYAHVLSSLGHFWLS